MLPLVALLVSAWIEIAKNRQINQLQPIVALLVSAWIEICNDDKVVLVSVGRTPRECVD